MILYQIVETDNFGSDYPDEKFVSLPLLRKDDAEAIAKVINDKLGGDRAPRYWLIVERGYKLQPGFEP